MPVLYLLCGLSFAGKSTLAAAIAEACAGVIISLDTINEERGLGFGGDGIPVEEWERTHHRALARLDVTLGAGQSVVLDDTNNLRWLRDRFRAVADAHGVEIWIVYLDIPPAVIRQRMEQNAETNERLGVQPQIFAELVRSFEPPAPDEQVVTFRYGDDIAEWLQRCVPPSEAAS